MKQDAVLVRNLVQNVGRRFDRVSQRCAERTRQLDVGFREAKAFDDARNRLMTWIDDAAASLAETEQACTATEPEKIRSQISAHRDFQRSLGSKQSGLSKHFVFLLFFLQNYVKHESSASAKNLEKMDVVNGTAFTTEHIAE